MSVCLAPGAVRCCDAKSAQQAQVVVTREAGKNGKLKQALQDCNISVLELPLVETKFGPERCGMSLTQCVLSVLPSGVDGKPEMHAGISLQHV